MQQRFILRAIARIALLRLLASCPTQYAAQGLPCFQSMNNIEGISLPLSDQSCNECRRRKARCNKTLPECSTCSKFRRHCLYEKNSKTPLTRRYLTEVEARLERAEQLLQRYRQRDLRLNQKGSQNSSPRTAPSSEFCHGTIVDTAPSLSIDDEKEREVGSYMEPEMQQKPCHRAYIPGTLYSNDFEWDEIVRPMAFGDGRSYSQRVADADDPIRDDEDHIALDGMATLTLNERHHGYLGSATGAAFLKHLWQCPTPSVDQPNGQSHNPSIPASIPPSIDPSKLVADPFIDAYFSLFHISYPLIHEPSFRAIYSDLIPRPAGTSWPILLNMVAAIGAFTCMTKCMTIDTPFYFAARQSFSIDDLETGNITLVQALVLMAYYLQKRNKPNSGYTYAGLAKRMAYGLGLHREFSAREVPIIRHEMRRRLWWSIFVIDSSMSVTLSRPLDIANDAIVDVNLPINITERDLTPQTLCMPHPLHSCWTSYTAIRAQANFYKAIQELYSFIIGNKILKTDEIIALDEQHLGNWYSSLPQYVIKDTTDKKYALSQAILHWRFYNFRMILYRHLATSADSSVPPYPHDAAWKRCIQAAHETIESVSSWWSRSLRTRMGAWYSLYFIFQAVLIPITSLRHNPRVDDSSEWKSDISKTLDVIENIHFIHSSKCAAVIHQLTDTYMRSEGVSWDYTANSHSTDLECNDHEATRGVMNHEQDLEWFGRMLEEDGASHHDAWAIMWPGVPTIEHDMQDTWLHG